MRNAISTVGDYTVGLCIVLGHLVMLAIRGEQPA
jgi:hypothetical protein